MIPSYRKKNCMHMMREREIFKEIEVVQKRAHTGDGFM